METKQRISKLSLITWNPEPILVPHWLNLLKSVIQQNKRECQRTEILVLLDARVQDPHNLSACQAEIEELERQIEKQIECPNLPRKDFQSGTNEQPHQTRETEVSQQTTSGGQGEMEGYVRVLKFRFSPATDTVDASSSSSSSYSSSSSSSGDSSSLSSSSSFVLGSVATKLNYLALHAKGTHIRFFSLDPRNISDTTYRGEISRDLLKLCDVHDAGNAGAIFHFWNGKSDSEITFTSFVVTKKVLGMVGGFAFPSTFQTNYWNKFRQVVNEYQAISLLPNSPTPLPPEVSLMEDHAAVAVCFLQLATRFVTLYKQDKGVITYRDSPHQNLSFLKHLKARGLLRPIPSRADGSERKSVQEHKLSFPSWIPTLLEVPELAWKPLNAQESLEQLKSFNSEAQISKKSWESVILDLGPPIEETTSTLVTTLPPRGLSPPWGGGGKRGGIGGDAKDARRQTSQKQSGIVSFSSWLPWRRKQDMVKEEEEARERARERFLERETENAEEGRIAETRDIQFSDVASEVMFFLSCIFFLGLGILAGVTLGKVIKNERTLGRIEHQVNDLKKGEGKTPVLVK